MSKYEQIYHKILNKIENGEYLLDADFAKALKRYSSQKQRKAN